MTELYLTADILPQFLVSNSNSNSTTKYETKIKLNKMKQNETKLKQNEIKQNEMKRNKTKPNETLC